MLAGDVASVFASERLLQTRIAEALPIVLDGESMGAVRREMPVGSCIPDVVFVRVFGAPRTTLWPRNWSFRHACIVAQLRGRAALQPASLARLAYEREVDVCAMLGHLEQSGAIVRSARGAVALSPEMRAVRTQITAVEAKLERWQDALAQAAAYREFADRALVAMDAGAARLLAPRVVEKFRSAGVGLCVVDAQKIRFLTRGRVARASSAKREYVAASLFAERSQRLWMRR